MTHTPQSRGKCQYCGEETAKSGMSRHLAKCAKRAQIIQSANAGKQREETLWHLRVVGAQAREFWLDLEMRGTAKLEKLDDYLPRHLAGVLRSFECIHDWRVGRGGT